MPTHHFKAAALIASLLAALCAAPVSADEAFTDKQASLRLKAQMDSELQADGPQIQSLAEFRARQHDGSKGMKAFDKLPETARQQFIAGLVFGDRGLGGFNFTSLKGHLGPQDAYRLLGMLGAQSYLARFVDGLQDETPEDRLLRQALLASIPPREPVRFANATSAATPLMRLDMQDNSFHAESEDAKPGLTLAVYFSPTCSPCIRTAKDFERSSALKHLMASCGRWTAQLDDGADARDLRRWSVKHNNATIWAIGDWGRYGAMPPQGTPTFFLIRDGRVVDQIVGWPPEGQEQALLKLVRRWDKERRCG